MSAKAKSDRSHDDLLALFAILIGSGVAYLHWRQPLDLGGGVALALGGVILALRGDKIVVGRSWLRAALIITGMATLLSLALGTYAEWIVGQWFSEGSQPGETAQELRRMGRYAAWFRITALAMSAAFLVGAVFGREPNPDVTKATNDPTKRPD